MLGLGSMYAEHIRQRRGIKEGGSAECEGMHNNLRTNKSIRKREHFDVETRGMFVHAIHLMLQRVLHWFILSPRPASWVHRAIDECEDVVH